MSLVLQWADWPVADQIMWHDLRKEAGPLDERGALAHLRQASCTTLEASYGRWLKWLSATDPDAFLLPPAERATLSRLESWLKALAHTKPMSRLMFVDGVLRILRSAAPELDWRMHKRLLAGLKREAGRGDPARKNGRVLSSMALLKAGLRLAGSDADGISTKLKSMISYRDGAMIAFLAVLPMRRRAFCELRLGRSIHTGDSGINILLTEEMTKTGAPWEAIVPAQIEPVLRKYIDIVRPALLARGRLNHDALWVGKKGELIGQNYIGSRIGTLTERLTGQRVPPHFFRDAAATTLARFSPEAARLIRPVLAHSGSRTAERHYIQAQTIDAARDYASLIKRLKEGKL